MDLYPACSNKRIEFLFSFSQTVKERALQGSLLEAGVFQGEYAKYINRFFPDRKLYLCDTFSGFEKDDTNIERGIINTAYLSNNTFSNTSVELVRQKMPNPDKVEFIIGQIPATLSRVEGEFVFVNLDMDLYKPTFEALKFLYPRLAMGGIMLLHDYFWPYCPGIKKAIVDYENYLGYHLYKFSIGDNMSLAVLKCE